MSKKISNFSFPAIAALKSDIFTLVFSLRLDDFLDEIYHITATLNMFLVQFITPLR